MTNRQERDKHLLSALIARRNQPEITPVYVPDPLDEWRDTFTEKSEYAYSCEAHGRGYHYKKKGIKPENHKNRLLAFTLYSTIITLLCVIIFSAAFFTHAFDMLASRKEQGAILNIMHQMERDIPAADTKPEITIEPDIPQTVFISTFDIAMREINNDYLCWINIDQTAINYPVVRGKDNEKYLDESFFGAKNALGSLFMDYRCVGEEIPNIIIYGHNTRYGDMFSGLHKFLDRQYRENHPIITLRIDDRIVEYEIFSARKTNVSDPAYHLDFNTPGSFQVFLERCGAPDDAGQIITLSTCVSGSDVNERVIVQGALRQSRDTIKGG